MSMQVEKQLAMLAFAVMIQAATCLAQTINIGYPVTDEVIWAYDGLYLSVDAKAGAAIKVTKEMYKNYIGGTVKSIRMGWGDPGRTGKITVFARTELSDTTTTFCTSKPTTVKYTSDGTSSYSTKTWNTVTLTTPIELTEDLGDFYIGYYVDVKANSYCISKLYPQGMKGSCYMWRDEKGYNYDTDGKELWEDQSSAGALALQLVATVQDAKNRAEIVSIVTPPIIDDKTAATGLLKLKNSGTNEIKNITLKYSVESKEGIEGKESKESSEGSEGSESSESVRVNLSTALKAGETTTITVPVKAVGSGEVTVRIDKVNLLANKIDSEKTIRLLCIPSAVAKKYERRSLVEFYESEAVYYVPQYYDEYFYPGYKDYKDRVSLIAHHTGDQFMTGMDEEVLMMQAMTEADESLTDGAAVASFSDTPLVVNPAQSFDCTLYICNMSAEPLRSATLTLSDGETSNDYAIDLSTTPLPAHQAMAMDYEFAAGEKTGAAVTYTLTVAQVNGKEATKTKPCTKQMYVAGDAFERIPLVEEFTSQRCQNCPFMAYFLDEAMEQWKNEGHQVVYVTHHTGFAEDTFTSSVDREMLYLFGTSNTFNPAVMYDRRVFSGDISPVHSAKNVAESDQYYDAISTVASVPGMARVMVSESTTADGKHTVKVSGELNKGIVDEGNKLYLSTYVIENGISTKDAPQLGLDDEDAPSDLKDKFRHNGIIRISLSDVAMGDEIQVSRGDKYTFEVEYEPVSYKEGWDVNNMNVVAFVHMTDKDDLTRNYVLNAGALINSTSGIEDTSIQVTGYGLLKFMTFQGGGFLGFPAFPELPGFPEYPEHPAYI